MWFICIPPYLPSPLIDLLQDKVSHAKCVILCKVKTGWNKRKSRRKQSNNKKRREEFCWSETNYHKPSLTSFVIIQELVMSFFCYSCFLLSHFFFVLCTGLLSKRGYQTAVNEWNKRRKNKEKKKSYTTMKRKIVKVCGSFFGSKWG